MGSLIERTYENGPKWGHQLRARMKMDQKGSLKSDHKRY